MIIQLRYLAPFVEMTQILDETLCSTKYLRIQNLNKIKFCQRTESNALSHPSSTSPTLKSGDGLNLSGFSGERGTEGSSVPTLANAF